MDRQHASSIIRWAIVFLAFLLSQNSWATTFFDQEFVCPIGGEEFTASVVGSNSTFGARPDGRPYSPLPIYPITECPGNGFLIFKDEWTSEELRVLGQAIETPEFARMRNEETQYYRLWWLSDKIGVDAHLLAQHLLVASWETDHDVTRKARYQRAFADAADQLEQADDPENWFWLTLRAANARRELGQFEAAAVQFANVEQNMSVISDEGARDYVTEFIAGQRQLIAEENTASEPATLVPASSAAMRCVLGSDDLTESELPICESDEVQDQIRTFRITTEEGASLVGPEAFQYLVERNRSRR